MAANSHKTAPKGLKNLANNVYRNITMKVTAWHDDYQYQQGKFTYMEGKPFSFFFQIQTILGKINETLHKIITLPPSSQTLL